VVILPSSTPAPAQTAPKSLNPRYDTKYQYKYDSQGNRIEINRIGSDGSQITKSVFTLDSKGNKVRQDVYNNDTKLQYRISIFDNNGNETESTYYSKDGSVQGKYKFEYLEFDGKRNWTKRRMLLWNIKTEQFVLFSIDHRTI